MGLQDGFTLPQGISRRNFTNARSAKADCACNKILYFDPDLLSQPLVFRLLRSSPTSSLTFLFRQAESVAVSVERGRPLMASIRSDQGHFSQEMRLHQTWQYFALEPASRLLNTCCACHIPA